MRRIADQEPLPYSVTVRDLRHQRPRKHVLDLDVVLPAADRVTQDLRAHLGRKTLTRRHRRIVRVEHAPAVLDVVGDQHASVGRLHDPVQDTWPTAHHVTQISGEVDGDEGLRCTVADHLDAERAPNGAARSVSPDDVAGRNAGPLLRRRVFEQRRHRLAGLLATGPDQAAPQLDQRRFGHFREEEILEQRLSQIDERRRCHLPHLLVLPLVRHDADLLAGEGGDETDPPTIRGRRGTGLERLHVEARGATDLQSARIQRMCFWRAVPVFKSFDDDGTQALPCKQDRGHQADRARAHDECSRTIARVLSHFPRSVPGVPWK